MSQLFLVCLASSRTKHFLPRLSIPGLAERKPSVLVGDRFLIRKCGAQDDKWHEGVVHRVYVTHVSLHLSSKFSLHRHPSKKVDVRFQLNCMPLRREHHAVAAPTVPSPRRILFPGEIDTVGLGRASSANVEDVKTNLVDQSLADDEEQLETIAAIVNMPPGSVPFIVYGP